MLKIPVVKGNINKALKQFKVKFKNTQVLKEVRERKHYTKPSLKRKVGKEEAIRKLKKQQEDE
jgi:small subunit ribosomal protein S21